MFTELVQNTAISPIYILYSQPAKAMQVIPEFTIVQSYLTWITKNRDIRRYSKNHEQYDESNLQQNLLNELERYGSMETEV